MKKKILVLSTGDVNGAYEAMYKIALILQKMGNEVILCVKNRTKNDDFIKVYRIAPKYVRKSLLERAKDKIKTKFFPKSQKITNLYTDPKYCFLGKDEKSDNINVEHLLETVGFSPDFIFTGMTIDFINSKDLLNIYNATKANIFNITVDMNHFTGGCHFSWGCEGYIHGCSEQCPAILNVEQKVTAKINFEEKLKNARKANFQVIAGSGLTLEQARESKIYKDQTEIYNVNSLIDTNILNNKNRSFAKQIFSFSNDLFYILAGSQNMEDPRKGFSYLIDALEILDKTLPESQKEKIVLLVVSNITSKEFESVSFKKEKIDYIKDYRLLSLLYQATDVFVNTSIEDSGPMMVSEALACGTPVVGFDTGIVMNMVIDDYNGVKIPMKDSQKLADGIKKIFDLEKNQYNTYSENAVKQVEEFSSYEYAEKIFSKILES